MKRSIRTISLSQQMALLTAGLCLLVSLALVMLATISARHVQLQQEEQYGTALALQVARQVSRSMERGDLLSATASLQRYIEMSAAEEVTLTDIEGKMLGQAGRSAGTSQHRYSAPVYIESDIAGQIHVTTNADPLAEAQMRFVLTLLGLAVLLSMIAYAVGMQFGQRMGARLNALTRTIALEGEDKTAQSSSANELDKLSRQIDALPMDLLRTRSDPMPQDENYQTTAVLYLHLSSLMDYVDTLDEHSLQRYTDRLHQVVYAAAGFYAGELHVARQFGLAIYFNGQNSAGSAAFRATSCAWLVGAVSRELEQQMTLSLAMSMAVSQSELGVGDGGDIYPGLYMQHTLDELQLVCTSKPPHILLSPAAAGDVDVSSRLEHRPTEVRDYVLVEGFADPYEDLLERQLRLMLKRLNDPAGR